ncbi:MAG: hypothetical protein H6828_02200 [Planctomycetes bacterium]|nr:hypothetical protein [Planctomycetota bacterium]
MTAPDPQALPGQHLEAAVQSTGARLHQALTQVLEGLPGGGRGQQHLARELGIDKVLASRLRKGLRDADPVAVVHRLPGPEPLRRFLQAATAKGAAPERVIAASEAVDAFEALIRDAGDRTALGAILAAWLPEAREEFELRRKQTAFRAMSQIKGAESEVDFSVALLHPAEDPEFLDVVWVIGLLRLRRLRPDARVKFAVRHTTPGAGPHVPTDLAGVPMSRLEDVRLDQFCEAPPAPLVAHQNRNEVRYTLGDTGFGPDSSVDLVFAEVARGELPRYPKQDPPRRAWFFTEIQTPTKRHQFDVFVADGVYTGAPPELVIYDTACEGLADPNDPARDVDRLDTGERITPLGRGLANVRTADIPRYVDLLKHVFTSLGRAPDDYHGYRARIDYPVYGSQVCQVFQRAPRG